MAKRGRRPTQIARLGVVVGLVLGSGIGAAGQGLPSCGGGVYDYVGVETGKPFTAERVTKSVTRGADGSEKTTEFIALVARDSAGRIRIERHSPADMGTDNEELTLQTRDGGTITTTRGEVHVVTTIFDCTTGEMILLQSGMRTARVMERGIGASHRAANRPSRRMSPRSQTTNFPRIYPSRIWGQKRLRAFQRMGTGPLNGDQRARRIRREGRSMLEEWVSDDLAATVLDIKSDVEGKSETRSRLTNIKREEPDEAFFKIPEGYKVNPAPSEMLYQVVEKK